MNVKKKTQKRNYFCSIREKFQFSIILRSRILSSKHIIKLLSSYYDLLILNHSNKSLYSASISHFLLNMLSKLKLSWHCFSKLFGGLFKQFQVIRSYNYIYNYNYKKFDKNIFYFIWNTIFSIVANLISDATDYTSTLFVSITSNSTVLSVDGNFWINNWII